MNLRNRVGIVAATLTTSIALVSGTSATADVHRRTDAASDHTTAATCTRMPDWYMSCKCPVGYQVVVYWNAVKSPSYLWYGYNISHMQTNRGGIGATVWGANPHETTGLGYHSKSINTSGPVYYSPGAGSLADRVSSMGARCSAAWIAPPAPEF